MIPIAEPLIGDEEKLAVLDVLNSGMLAQGPKVQMFEEAFAKYCGVKYAVATSSGTTALHTALLASDIGFGDEVITTPFTFIASANAVLYVGAKPVFVDIDPQTFNINPRLLESAITPRTKAILPVHLFGLPADMDAISEIAKRYGLLIIEDACQGHGAKYKSRRVGSFAVGCFSFYPTKNMTTAEGGMITTDDNNVYEKCLAIRQHGMRERYYHDEIGYNFRMTDLQAAIGLVQLGKLERFNEQRISNARYLTAHLYGAVAPLVTEECKHVFHQYTVRIINGRRDTVLHGLRQCGITAGIYYPVPVHRQKLYKDLGYDDKLPEAELASKEVLSLPVHPGLSQTDLDTIVGAFNELCI